MIKAITPKLITPIYSSNVLLTKVIFVCSFMLLLSEFGFAQNDSTKTAPKAPAQLKGAKTGTNQNKLNKKKQSDKKISKIPTATIKTQNATPQTEISQNPQPGVTTLVQAPAPLKTQSHFGIGTAIYYEQSLEKKSDGTLPKAAVIELTPSLKYETFKIENQTMFGYDLNNPKESDWSDSIFVAKYTGWKPLNSINVTPVGTMEVPLSKESREKRGINLITGAGLNLSLNCKYLGCEKFSLSYQAVYSHFHNQYTTRLNGEPATKYKITQTITTTLDIEAISFFIQFQFVNNSSYEDVIRDGFFHVEMITYNITKKIALMAYHYNKGPFLNPATYENNLSFYDKESSTVGLGLGYSF